MTNYLLRFATSAFLVTTFVLLIPPVDATAQSANRKGNVHFMELSLRPDADRDGKIACLGTPDTLHVMRKDIVIFRSSTVNVNHVRWGGDDLNENKTILSDDGSEASPEFERGAAWAIRISNNIPKGREDATRTYELNVKCGDFDDAPPVIIVDP